MYRTTGNCNPRTFVTPAPLNFHTLVPQVKVLSDKSIVSLCRTYAPYNRVFIASGPSPPGRVNLLAESGRLQSIHRQTHRISEVHVILLVQNLRRILPPMTLMEFRLETLREIFLDHMTKSHGDRAQWAEAWPFRDEEAIDE